MLVGGKCWTCCQYSYKKNVPNPMKAETMRWFYEQDPLLNWMLLTKAVRNVAGT